MKLNFSETEQKIESINEYSKDCLSLEIKINYSNNNEKKYLDILDENLGIKMRTFILSIDTLSLYFSGADLNLQSIDAYSNYKNWVNRLIKFPSVLSSSICSIEGELIDDRRGVDGNIVYYYDSMNLILEIRIDDSASDCYYQISPDIVVGVKANMAVSIYIKNLRIK